ncbi:MAG TPA: DoxX family protein [Candidatus Angelobacter sp.]|nr:DoxX family protein [Candidatus Angelobacter sp.]
MKIQTDNPSTSKKRRVAGNVLIFLGAFVLVASAGSKFAQVPKVVSELGAMGFDGSRLMFIAVLEMFSAILFVVPFSRAAGLLMVSAYMGGAIATHIQHGQSPLQPAIILAILWVGTWLRHPEALWIANSMRHAKSSILLQTAAQSAASRD